MGQAKSVLSGRRQSSEDLSHAIHDDNVDWLSQLVHHSPSLLTSKLEHGNNAVHLAVLSRHHAILRHILSFDSDGCANALTAACVHGIRSVHADISSSARSNHPHACPRSACMRGAPCTHAVP